MLCTDTDLLRWEPRLAIDAALAAQTVFEGRGRLSGRRLACDVPPACADAIVVIGDACYATLRAGDASLTIGPAALGVCAAMPADGHVVFAVRSFAQQRALVNATLDRLFDINVGLGRRERGAAFRRPCALGALHLIYASLAAASLGDDADWHVRAELYGRLYRKTLRAACADVDDDSSDEHFANQEVA